MRFKKHCFFSAVSIGGIITTLYYLHIHACREYHSNLRIIDESNNKNDNGNPFNFISKKFTLFVIIFLIAEVFMTFVGAWREIVESTQQDVVLVLRLLFAIYDSKISFNSF